MGKRNQTRERIRAAATELFTAHGYDMVTVEEITAAAGVSHMTFFRHFGTKDAVLLDDPYDPLIAAAVAASPSDLPPLQRVCAGVAAAWTQIEHDELGDMRAQLRIAADHPRLRARMWENTSATQHAIAEALVAGGTARFEAEVAAAACMGALIAALLDWARTGTDPLGDRIGRALAQLVPAPAGTGAQPGGAP